MQDEASCELEVSPLSCDITSCGVSVEVHIYRIAGRDGAWTLEVVTDNDGGSKVWEDKFPTDAAALQEFRRTLDEEGILALISDDTATRH